MKKIVKVPKAFLTPADRGIKGRIAAYYKLQLLRGEMPLCKVPLWLMRNPKHCKTLAAYAVRGVRCSTAKRYNATLQEILHLANVIEASAKSPQDLLSAQLLKQCYDFYTADYIFWE